MRKRNEDQFILIKTQDFFDENSIKIKINCQNKILLNNFKIILLLKYKTS